MMILLTLLLKSLLVFAFAGAVLFGLRRASAAARHLVCLLTLASLLALPLFSLTLPGWHLPVLEMRQAGALPETTQEPSPAQVLSPPETEQLHPTGRVRVPGNAATDYHSSSSRFGRTPAQSPVTAQGVGFQLLTLYFFGVLVAGLRPLLGLWGITRLQRLCTVADDTQTQTVATRCAALLRLPTPRVCRADVCVPMTWGWRRPVVLLPCGSDTWPEDRIRSVLLHEMAHIQRRDWPSHRLADLVCALYWFHPFVWLVARRLRAESEAACDDLVVASGISAPDYARHLLDIARALPPSSRLPQSAAIAMAQTSQIKGRITMILDKTQSRRTLTRRALLFALIPSTAALVSLAMLRPDAKAQTMPQTTPPHAAGLMNLTFSSVMASANVDSGTNLTVSPDLKINGTTLFAGMTDADKPGSPWWSAGGTLLPTPVYDTNIHRAENHAGHNTHNVSFAFRLPADAAGTTAQYDIAQCVQSSSDGFWVTKIKENAQRTEAQMFPETHGTRVVTAAFPLSVTKTNIRVGIASGDWKTAARESFTHDLASPSGGTDGNAGDTGSSQTTPDGTFIFSAIRLESGNASGLTVTTSEPKQDLRIVAVDAQGHSLLPALIGGNSAAGLDQITVHFAQPLAQIKEIRVETRPFQWVEFKDIALQPAQ